jgi:hypothetical protein
VQWRGLVHERLTRPDRPARTESVPRKVLRLRHVGYASPEIRRHKAELRVELGRRMVDELALQGDGADPSTVAHTLLDLGRSLVAADRHQDAVDVFETLRDLCPGTEEWVHATDFLARLVLGSGMDEVCLVLMEQLRAAGANAAYCDWLEAQALAQLGDVETAQTLLEGVTEVVDTVGRAYDPSALRELKRLVGRLRLAAVQRV